MRHTSFWTSCVFALAALFGEAIQQTLPERAAANGGKPVRVAVIPHYIGYSFTDMVNAAQLVVVGQLVNPKSYLIGDGRSIATDYQLILKDVISDRAATTTRAQPGQTRPLTVTFTGGELVLNGVSVTVAESGMNKWSAGADLLLFLERRNDGKDGFYLLGGPATAFEIDTNGRAKSLRTQGRKEEDIEGIELSAVVAKIRKALRPK